MVDEAGNPENPVAGPAPVNSKGRKGMDRKELIRLLLEVVQGVRGYALAGRGDLVLAPSKTNPAVKRWQRVDWGWIKDGAEDAGSGFIPELGHTLNVAHLLHKLHKRGHVSEKALEAVMPDLIHRFENLPEEKKKKLREDPRYKEFFQYYDAYREKRTPKLLKAVDKLVHGMKPWKSSKENRGFSLGGGTTESLVDWRGTMERKEAIRLLLEAVREVRSYTLGEGERAPSPAEERLLQAMERYRGYALGEGLVLAPSKKNPRVMRWQRLAKDMVESWEEEDRELAEHGPEEVAKRGARKALEALKDLHQRTRHPREREVLEHLIKHTEKLAEHGPEELTKREAKQAAEELRGLYYGAKHPKKRAAIEALVKHAEELAEMGPGEIAKRDAQGALEKIRDLHRRTKHPKKKEALERLMKHVEELAELGPGGVARKDAQERLKAYQEVKGRLE